MFVGFVNITMPTFTAVTCSARLCAQLSICCPLPMWSESCTQQLHICLIMQLAGPGIHSQRRRWAEAIVWRVCLLKPAALAKLSFFSAFAGPRSRAKPDRKFDMTAMSPVPNWWCQQARKRNSLMQGKCKYVSFHKLRQKYMVQKRGSGFVAHSADIINALTQRFLLTRCGQGRLLPNAAGSC